MADFDPLQTHPAMVHGFCGRLLFCGRILGVDCQSLIGLLKTRPQTGRLGTVKDVTSGKGLERPGLAELLNYLRPGDTSPLCGWTG
jgi:hypothetical protein